MGKQLTRSEFEAGISYIQASDQDRHWPHDWRPNEVVKKGQVVIEASPLQPTQDAWNAYQYNPPQHMLHKFPSADGRATVRPKPSWDDIVAGSKLFSVKGKLDRAHYNLTEETHNDYGSASFHKKALSDATPLPSSEVYVGEGLNHMGGLIHLVDRATNAGMGLPPIYMRKGDAIKALWTQAQLKDVLEATALRENIVESAHNKLMAEYRKLLATANDAGRSATARLGAATKAEKLSQEYRARLESEMAKYNPDALPDDLPTRRGKLIEILEAAATNHQQYLKGGLTQQAIDNWAQCVGIDAALREVSKQCALASIRIRRARDSQDASIAFDDGVKAIEGVTAVHTPVWEIDGTGYAANPSSPVLIDKSNVKVTAKHPDDQKIDGDVHVAFAATEPIRVVRGGLGTLTPASSDSGVVAIKVPKPGESVTITATARSLCGPSVIEVVLTPPEALP